MVEAKCAYRFLLRSRVSMLLPVVNLLLVSTICLEKFPIHFRASLVDNPIYMKQVLVLFSGFSFWAIGGEKMIPFQISGKDAAKESSDRKNSDWKIKMDIIVYLSNNLPRLVFIYHKVYWWYRLVYLVNSLEIVRVNVIIVVIMVIDVAVVVVIDVVVVVVGVIIEAAAVLAGWSCREWNQVWIRRLQKINKDSCLAGTTE